GAGRPGARQPRLHRTHARRLRRDRRRARRLPAALPPRPRDHARLHRLLRHHRRAARRAAARLLVSRAALVRRRRPVQLARRSGRRLLRPHRRLPLRPRADPGVRRSRPHRRQTTTAPPGVLSPMRRIIVLGTVLAFIAGFAFLTVAAVIEQGFTIASLLSFLILALLAIGIVGALRNPPR